MVCIKDIYYKEMCHQLAMSVLVHTFLDKSVTDFVCSSDDFWPRTIPVGPFFGDCLILYIVKK